MPNVYKSVGAMILMTALISLAAVTIPTTTVEAASASERAKAWRTIRGGSNFRRWSQGIRYRHKAVAGTSKKCIRVAFTGGNGKVWYIRIAVRKKTSRNRTGYRWFPRKSLASCKAHRG